MKKVVIESPFSGDTETNIAYARACMRDSLLRGEAPLASHLLYTQEGILDDTVLNEREQGMEAGIAWSQLADLCAVYIDLGVSLGMERGIERAVFYDIPIETRSLGENWRNP